MASDGGKSKKHKAYGPTPGKAATKAAFHEVMHNEPEIVGQTRRKKGEKAAHRQEVAIALSKARRGDV